MNSTSRSQIQSKFHASFKCLQKQRLQMLQSESEYSTSKQYEKWEIDGKKYIVYCPPLGQSTYGKVFKAYDLSRNQFIAIKYIKAHFVQQEIDALTKLNKYKQIINYFESFEEKVRGGGYILMEYFPGTTLQERLTRIKKKAKQKDLNQKGLHERIVLKVASQLMEGIQAIHEQKLKHCDIKPDNILVNDEGETKIIDLGLACDQKKTNIGTTVYCPPEHFEKKDQKKQIPFWARDVWSCGIVILEMLTGEHPCQDYFRLLDLDSRKTYQQRFLQEAKQGIKIQYGPEYSKKWSKILSMMLQYQAYKRKPIKEIKKQLNIIEAQRMKDQLALKKIGLRNIFNSSIETIPELIFDPQQILQSDSLTSKLIRDLKYFHCKYQFIPLFCKLITQEKYPFIPKYYKYLFLFLVLGFYLKSLSELFVYFENQEICIDFVNPVKYTDKLGRNDYEYFNQVVKKYRMYYEEEKAYYQGKMENKVIPNLKKYCPDKQQPSTYRQLIYQSSSIISSSLYQLIQAVSQANYSYTSRQQFLTKLEFHNKTQKRPKKELQRYFYATDLSIYYLTEFIQKIDHHFQQSDISSIDLLEQIYTSLSISQSKNNDEELRLTLLKQIKSIEVIDLI